MESWNKLKGSVIGQVVGETDGERRAREDRSSARVAMQPVVHFVPSAKLRDEVYEAGGRWIMAFDVANHDKTPQKSNHVAFALDHGKIWEPPNPKRGGIPGLVDKAKGYIQSLTK